MIRDFIFIFFLILVCYGMFYYEYKIRGRQQPSRKTSNPIKKATLFDVKHLISKGEQDLAVRVYCEIFHVPVKEGQKAVDDLAKVIKAKRPEVD